MSLPAIRSKWYDFPEGGHDDLDNFGAMDVARAFLSKDARLIGEMRLLV